MNFHGLLVTVAIAGALLAFANYSQDDEIEFLDDLVVLGSSNVEQTPPTAPNDPRSSGSPPRSFAELPVVDEFDLDGDGRLNAQERSTAREDMKNRSRGRGFGPLGVDPSRGGFSRGFGSFGPPAGPGRPGDGRPFGFGHRGGYGARDPAKPGVRVAPSDVARFPNADLYEPAVLRTLFLEFENDDWEAELAAFARTDVLVTAKLAVDGATYPDVGVRFRRESFTNAPAGYKRSLEVAIDFIDQGQRLHGRRTLKLLGGQDDPSFMTSMLYSQLARERIVAPRANMVKLVVNGENWGVYANIEELSELSPAKNAGAAWTARWKANGMPGAASSLEYVGENVDDYRRQYEIEFGDDESWQRLIALCRTIDQATPARLEAALAPMLDVDAALWFLAYDNALMNSAGYWNRSADYGICLDSEQRFHLVPRDMHAAFRFMAGQGATPGDDRFGSSFAKNAATDYNAPHEGGFDGRRPSGFGFGGEDATAASQPQRQESRSIGFDNSRAAADAHPLAGLEDPQQPLRSKLLAVPALRQRYLRYLGEIAERQLDWKSLGPIVAQGRELIVDEVAADTKKLSTQADFERATSDDDGDGNALNLRAFAEARRAYLLDRPEVKRAMTGAKR